MVEFADTAPEMHKLINAYAGQAADLTRQGAQIILMPEKTGLMSAPDTTSLDLILQLAADRTGATLVIGIVHVVARDFSYEARLYSPGLPIATYDKQHMLSPFEVALKPGNSLTLLPSSASPIGAAICKDMDFIHPALEYGRAGIDLLLD